nr:MAG TPA: hypothetical protein [Caudoviricetes sp.]
MCLLGFSAVLPQSYCCYRVVVGAYTVRIL